MKTIFFATNLFEILQVQNIVIELKIAKENAVLILWLKNTKIFNDLLSETEKGIFGSIECFEAPEWPSIGNKTRRKLFIRYSKLQQTILQHDPEEIFISDPEKGFQLLQYICKEYRIKLSMYEAGLNTYRYLNNFDPNCRTLSYRLNKAGLINMLMKKHIRSLISKKNKDSDTTNNFIHQLLIIIFYQLFPEIGQFFMKKTIRPILFRIEDVHRFLCTNPEIVRSNFYAEIIEKLSLNHLISNNQQMKIYATQEFWQINTNHLFFFDQNYLILGVTPHQHASLVLKCLESLGRISNITIKPHLSNSTQIANIYKEIIVQKEYKINIITSDVIPESIINVKKIRQAASLAGRSFIYAKIANPEVRINCLYKLYEEKAKEAGLEKNVLEKIKKHHDLFEAVEGMNKDSGYTTDILKLGEEFFIA